MSQHDETGNGVPDGVSMMEIVSAPIKRRVNALKNLQLNHLKLEAEFFTEVYKLECKYHPLFKEFYDQREKIINGIVEPTDEECVLAHPSMQEPERDDPEHEQLIKSIKENLTFSDSILTKNEAPGVPEFWLCIFKNVELLNDMIQPHDEPILKHLTDVQLVLNEDNMGFKILFLFSPNVYFTNSVLTKEYEMKCVPDENDPWSFEGPEIYKCKGCTIDWNKSMNVTLKTLRKRQRHKRCGGVRTLVKCVMNDSFFNFFNPPTVPDSGEVDEQTQSLLTLDFEIGHYIKDKIIPHAVLYYTGEALEDEEFDDLEESSESDDDFECAEEEGDDDDNEDDDDDSDGNDGDDKHTNHKQRSKGKPKSKSKNNPQQPQECAQQ